VRFSIIMVGLTMFAAVLTGTGCSGTLPYSKDGQYLKGPGNLQGVVGLMDSPIPDVPVPIGFVPILDDSDARLEGNVRVIQHVYQGRATINDVIEFYRRGLPLHDWKYVSEGQRGDEYLMAYTKGVESLRVAVRKRGMVLTLQINMGPSQPRSSGKVVKPNLILGASD